MNAKINTSNYKMTFENGLTISLFGLLNRTTLEQFEKFSQLVWCEEVHRYISKDAKCRIEGGVYNAEELRKDFLENIYTDVFNYDPQTKTSSEEGIAIVKDRYSADICFDDGWDVKHVRTHEKDEDGFTVEWWEVTPPKSKETLLFEE